MSTFTSIIISIANRPVITGSNCEQTEGNLKTVIKKKTSLPSYDTKIRQYNDQSKEAPWWSYDDFIIYM